METNAITFENYYISTRTTFRMIDTGREVPIIAWLKLSAQHARYERHFSPYSASQYLLDRKAGLIYRLSDHWGKVASCQWDIDRQFVRPDGSHGMTIGVALLSSFERI